MGFNKFIGIRAQLDEVVQKGAQRRQRKSLGEECDVSKSDNYNNLELMENALCVILPISENSSVTE